MKILSWLLVLLLLIGCSAPDLNKPPPIKVGRDVCGECGMVITDERFAAGYYSADGDARKFDDLGDLVQFMRKQQEAPALVWVHDYETRQWLSASDATYVVGPEVQGPHHGIAAFQSPQAAHQFAAPISAKVLTWTDLLSLELPGTTPHNHN